METYYNIRPRYSAGSPGAVRDRKTADSIIHFEKEFHAAALNGFWGPAWQARAMKEGLSGVVELHAVYGTRIEVHDLITGERRTIDRRRPHRVPAHVSTGGVA